jgi:hypothetical protein
MCLSLALCLAALRIRRELLDLYRHYFGPHGVAATHESARIDGQMGVWKPGFLVVQSGNCAADSAMGHHTPENYLGVHSTLQGSLWAYPCIKSTLQGILHEDAPILIYFPIEISNCHHECQFAVEGPSEVAGSARLAPRELMIRL